jgi:hypothetical protein
MGLCHAHESFLLSSFLFLLQNRHVPAQQSHTRQQQRTNRKGEWGWGGWGVGGSITLTRPPVSLAPWPTSCSRHTAAIHLDIRRRDQALVAKGIPGQDPSIRLFKNLKLVTLENGELLRVTRVSQKGVQRNADGRRAGGRCAGGVGESTRRRRFLGPHPCVVGGVAVVVGGGGGGVGGLGKGVELRIRGGPACEHRLDLAAAVVGRRRGGIVPWRRCSNAARRGPCRD